MIPEPRSRLVPSTFAAIALIAALAAGQGTPVGFEETYALASDRAKAVATLIPGTVEFYYYGCRERLDASDFAAVRKILRTWIDRHGRSPQVEEIENREALMSFAADPERTWGFLKQRLGLRFDDQRVVPGERTDLPTSLDPARLSNEALTRRAFELHSDTVDGFTDRALAGLAQTSLTPNRLRGLLTRLSRPDVDNLPALIVRDLDHKQSGGFGSLKIHSLLLRDQLEECLRLRPALLEEPRFVNAFLVRLQPGVDTVWQTDPAERDAQLAKLWEFAQRLPPVFNSLKAHVLYHRLSLDLSQGVVPDKSRFMEYIRLPRRTGHPSEAHLWSHQRPDEYVVGGMEYPTGLPAIGNDEALVRACLEAYFATEDSYTPYAEFLHADWLKTVLAETKILLGQGDLDRWSALLGDPGTLDVLKQRVEITFAPTSRMRYGAGDTVKLDLLVKNVPTLLLKVYAIDAYRYHVEKGAEVDSNMDLDGVVPNFEQTFTYAEPPLRRVLRTFDLPMLQGPGTYVVECVGNGISSRAVIRKGHLRSVDLTTAAGQAFRVFDEAGVQQKSAAIWFGGREYTADANGEILLPFSTSPGRHTVVLHEGARSALASFDHRQEAYRLEAPAHVDRESLIAGKKARILVQPRLSLCGRAVSLTVLGQPFLSVVATDLDGIETVQTVRDLALSDDRELVHEVSVPERLSSLRVSLGGRVKDLGGKDLDLQSAPVAFAVNGIDLTAATSGVQLVRTTEGFALEVRGKDGEPKVGHGCRLYLHHRDYQDDIIASLQTDAAGRIQLGVLDGIESVRVHQDNGYEGTFEIARPRFRVPGQLHGLSGETLRVPYQGASKAPSRAEFSLIGRDRDEFSRLALEGGFLELRGLEPGDYELVLHENGATVPVRVTKGTRNSVWLIGRDRVLEAAAPPPLNLKSLALEGDQLVVRVANASKGTRVHVVATRFAPPFDAFRDLLASVDPAAAFVAAERPENSYWSGRKLGDEYRYVLERRFAKKYPGNMLKRPSLLLNPWAVEDDSKNRAIEAGSPMGGSRIGHRAGQGGAAPATANPGGPFGPQPGAHASIDFLPKPSVLIANLAPDAEGVVRVKTADLGDGQIIHVLAVDGDQSVSDSILREEKKLQPRPRHLTKALDGTQRFVEQRRIQFVAAGGEAVLDDARSAKVEVYDSLAGVHRVLSTICPDPSLSKFAFVLRWAQLKSEEKQVLYTEHACHELHFFLFKKDPEFFERVVRPFLANKLDKTFLDHWLLGDDLAAYLEPWSFEHLNLIEKILLAQRLDPPRQAATARFVREGLEIRPVAIDQLERLFRSALAGKELDENRSVVTGLLVADAKPDSRPDARDEFAAKAPEEGREQEHKKNAEKLEQQSEESGRRSLDDVARAKRLGEDARKRGEVWKLYRAVDPTRVFAEHSYWHRRLDQMTADVVLPNHFWTDYATAKPGQPFVSSSVLEAGGSFLEAMFALSVLDLPFESGKHDVVADGDRRTLRAATPLLLVRKEIAKTEKAAGQAPLLLGENFFRLDDRFHFENGEKRDAFVTEEFLVDVAYGCQIVATNPTSSRRTAELLLQIPEGSLPLNRGFWTRGVTVELQPYATATVEYAFYFPAPGDFAHYPVHAAEKGLLAASADPRVLHVVTTPSRIDKASWEFVSQLGSKDDVLTHLESVNVQRLDLAKIAWRMHDRDFFTTIVSKLRERHVYLDKLWSYAIMHEDADAAREYLRHADAFLHACGAALRSPLVTIDPKERREFQHLELEPLVHARAHRLGGQRMIGNADLAQQYSRFMQILGCHERLDDSDWLGVTYYLLLQDRIEEGLATFAKIDPAKLSARIQYDYLQAYTGLFTGDVAGSRATALRYRDYPVDHWRKRFAEVLGHLDEAEGRATIAGADGSADSLAAQAPALEIALEGRQARISYKNLLQCEVRYYELDVEFAFSAQPFASEGGTSAAFVRPNLSETKDLPAGKSDLLFELPEAFLQKNVLVEVRGKGLVRSRTYFANALDVRFLESWGQVAVTEPGSSKPLPQAYVKVFAKLPNGVVRFHKDGYTDLRGRFDYASVSDDPEAGATQYSVLVLSEQRGAVIREVKPPAR